MSTTNEDFDFETIEKRHAEIDPTDQIVGVRFDGDLVARFRDNDGKDWIPGSFYDGEGIEEDRTGVRTFVVRVVEDDFEPSVCDLCGEGDDHDHDSDEYGSIDACPACGEPSDYCQGHGEIGDPEGFAILAAESDEIPVGLDYCQTCGKRISDHDENGYEDEETGQRGCLWHEGDVIHEDDEPDFSDATHCRHGSYVGTWDGPDHLCGWCEDGVSVVEMLEAQAFEAKVRARAKELVAENVYDALIAFAARENLSVGRLGTYLVDGVLASAECSPTAPFLRAAREELVEVGS